MMIRSFLLALSFLTRIPIPKNQDFKGVTLSQSGWSFPLAGALIGLLAAVFYLGALKLGINNSIAGWCTIAFMVLLTGGLHEDGLADMADGLAHGRDKEQKLAIMRDSRIGSYGVLALIITLAIRAGTISALPNSIYAIVAMVAAAAGSRACMVVLMYCLPPARLEGLAATAGRPSYVCMNIAFILGIAPLVFLPLQITVGCVLAIISVIMVFERLARKHFAGITGDVLGAAQLVSETLLLVILAS